MEDLESVLSESPGQQQSILRWIMGGDFQEPALMDQGFFNGGGGDQFGHNTAETSEIKPPIFNQQQVMNHHSPNPSFFSPWPYEEQQEKALFVPPPAKRHNPGGRISSDGSFLDMGQHDLSMERPALNPHHFDLLPHHLQQPEANMDGGDKLGQSILDELYKAAELVQTGNLVLAQVIFARLNQQLSPVGKPFFRSAFYVKEALELLLRTNNNLPNFTAASSPISLIFKISAYKSFCEISPLVQFANFTCSQALLEVFEGFNRIHIVDFDIGYGDQWASLMQEIALRSGDAPSLKITALALPSIHDQLELSLTRENLIQFANEINLPFEFDVMSIDYLISCSWSLPFHLSEHEAIGVNLPLGSLTDYQVSVPSVLRFVKQLSPRIIVSVDRGIDRSDLPFANHITHALQSYSNLLESLDAVNVNVDILQKIERFLLQPAIEKVVTDRFRSPENTQHWRARFLSSGFTPVAFSNFTESQADCVVHRTPIRGFQVEKRQSSLALCWQRKELIFVSAWRC